MYQSHQVVNVSVGETDSSHANGPGSRRKFEEKLTEMARVNKVRKTSLLLMDYSQA